MIRISNEELEKYKLNSSEMCRARRGSFESFLQAKHDSEIKVRFLLNEHADLSLLLHNNSVHIVLLNLKET